MNQVFRKVLEDYKRANKASKERMIIKYGFTTEMEFFTYLETMDPTAVPNTIVEPPTDMVIAFDTTGSMSAYINAVKAHVEETIDSLFENVPNLRLKIVAFGDYCDMTSTTVFGPAYQEIELTSDKNALKTFVRNAQNTSGGDIEEFYELVLKKILDETSWRRESKKSILLIADHEPHYVGYSYPGKVTKAQVDWKVEAKKAAAIGVKIDTLKILPNVRWYEELSAMTNGTCMNFKSASKTQNIVQASTYLNSESERGIGATRVLYRMAMDSGDDELVGAYKGMAASRGINLDD